MQNVLILLSSYTFYSWWDYRFAGLLIISTLTDFCASRAIYRSQSISTKRTYLALSIIINLSILGFFKYFNFFVTSLVDILHAINIQSDLTTLSIVLPVGISFYTFQTISYTVDVYRGKLKPCTSLIDYAAYLAFFPQLVAGPIERGANLVPQFEKNREFSYQNATYGLKIILWGVFKKLVIADNLALVVNEYYASPGEYSGLRLLVSTICFAFQIYCDFSSYSDIARGCAKLLGFDLMVNFSFPYFSRSVSEFWRRWHISLSTWFRDYVYIPLGGNRSGKHRMYVNLLLTFVISGLWHGAAYNYLIWGFLNGLGVILFSDRNRRGPQDTPLTDKWVPGLTDFLGMLCTFSFILVTWVFFRAASFGDAMLILRRIAAIPFEFSMGMLAGSGLKTALSYLAPFMMIEYFSRRYDHPFVLLNGMPRYLRWAAYVVFLVLIVYLMCPLQSEFVYFQF